MESTDPSPTRNQFGNPFVTIGSINTEAKITYAISRLTADNALSFEEVSCI